MTLNPRAPTPHGFVAYAHCARCGTERPETALTHSATVFAALAWLEDGGHAPDLAPAVCMDREWCDRQAGRATGLDANGDATP